MLEFKLFGTGQAHYCGQALAGFPTKQCHRLLCYLLLNPHMAHHREHLAATFWGDYPQDVSRKHLSKAIWRLRYALREVKICCDRYLNVDKDCVVFAGDGQYWLDIEAFEAKIESTKQASDGLLTPEQAGELEKAVDLYTGDLLEDIYEDWCLYDRERLALLYTNSLYRLMVFHENNGTYDQGIIYGKRLLARDNTNEKVHRQMMRLYWYSGNRAAALAQYQYCVQVLRDELNLAPLDEMRDLYLQIVHNQFGAGKPDNITKPPLVPGNSPQQIAERALQRLARLRTITEESSAEIQALNRSIQLLLSSTKHQ